MAEDKYKTIFSNNLRYYLEMNNKTQTDLVNDLNLSSSTVSNWCTAQKLPRMNKVQMLADYFGIEKSDLLEDKSKNKELVKLKESSKGISLFNPGIIKEEGGYHVDVIVSVELTKENYYKYQEEFDLLLDKAYENIYKNYGEKDILINVDTKKEITLDELKDFIKTITVEEKLQLLSSSIEKVEYNTILKTLYIKYK